MINFQICVKKSISNEFFSVGIMLAFEVETLKVGKKWFLTFMGSSIFSSALK